MDYVDCGDSMELIHASISEFSPRNQVSWSFDSLAHASRVGFRYERLVVSGSCHLLWKLTPHSSTHFLYACRKSQLWATLELFSRVVQARFEFRSSHFRWSASLIEDQSVHVRNRSHALCFAWYSVSRGKCECYWTYRKNVRWRLENLVSLALAFHLLSLD